MISLTLWGGRGESGASPPWLTLLLLQLERDFKVLMPVERRNTARRLQAGRDEVVTDGRLKELGEGEEEEEGSETAFSHFLKHLNAARLLNVTFYFCSLGEHQVHSSSCDSVGELQVDR